MTPKERVINRLKGLPVDRIPNLCILMAFSAKEYGICYSEYVTDYRKLVAADIAACEKYHIDLLNVISDPMREAEGFGTKVLYPQDGVPYAKEEMLELFSDWKNLKTFPSENRARMADRIHAIESFRRLAPDYAVAGWVEGAFAEACDLRGINRFMMDILDEEASELHGLLNLCAEQSIDFALKQIKAGADIIGIGDAACSLVSPEIYARYALPYEKKLVAAIHSAGAYAKLHICGNITKLIPEIVKTGADIVDIDWMVDFPTAIQKFAEYGIAGCGNFDPVSVLLRGTTETVEKSVKYCINNCIDNTFIAAGCEVPRDCPSENLMTVYRVLNEVAQ